MGIAESLSSMPVLDKVREQWSDPRRRTVLIVAGGVLGALAVGLGGYLVYDQVVTVPVPDIETASPKDIAGFVGHPRGLARMPTAKRAEFLYKLAGNHYEPARRRELASAFRQMTSEQKRTCREAVFDVGYEVLNEQVADFYKAPEQDRAEFIDRKIAEYHVAQRYVAGSPRAKREHPPLFDDSWMEGLPTDSDGVVKLMIAKTRPKDRARLKPYMEAIRARMDELNENPREKERLLAKYADIDALQELQH